MHTRSLLSAIIEAAGSYSGTIASDASGGKLTYRQLFLRGFLLSGPIEKQTRGEDYVGVLLPNTLAVMVTFVTLHMLGKVPCMLNFSSGQTNLLHACSIAQIKSILTSRAFIAQAKLEEIESALSKNHKLIYLEDIRDKLTLPQKLIAAAKSFFPRAFIPQTDADNPAVILYTSGSEGVPKGVALSHANILANINQVTGRLQFTHSDRMFNALPVFHSFGLTVGTLLPLILGIRILFYPSPLQYKQIPEAVRNTRATIFLGTDTFLQGYARTAEPDDFKTVRLAVAGAEKLKETTREFYLRNLGVEIFQGYGVTETSPVLSVNTPGGHKPGSVGRFFDGIEYRLEKVEGLEHGGRLLVKGPNVMLGYLKADKPGIIQPQGQWYDTGDIVDVDSDGYIFIQGRAKRFAKIGGEMVSLLAVEELASKLDSEAAHAAIAIPDERKGEQVVLFTESKTLTREALLKFAQENGVAELFLPKKVTPLDTIPRLGNGKIDYQTLQRS